MTIHIYKKVGNLEYIHNDDKESILDLIPDLKSGDYVICKYSCYAVFQEFSDEPPTINEWLGTNLTNWVLSGGYHEKVLKKPDYAVFENGKEVYLLPENSKTIFIDQATGERLGESSISCLEFNPIESEGESFSLWKERRGY